MKKYPTIGVCGLDCGLCPRYYTDGPSRCPGCDGPDFKDKHPSCSFITCCVKKRILEACGECPDFPCSKFRKEEEYHQGKESSSYPSYKKVLQNLFFIRENGIERFIELQNRRIRLLETMLKNFNDGRSRSLFCRKAGQLDPEALQNAVDRATREILSKKIKTGDLKRKAEVLKAFLKELSPEDGILTNDR